MAAGIELYEAGTEILPGLTTLAAFGHTPGHCAFAIASRNQSIMVMSDAVRNPYLFARYPDAEAIEEPPIFRHGEGVPVGSLRRESSTSAAHRESCSCDMVASPSQGAGIPARCVMAKITPVNPNRAITGSAVVSRSA